MALPILGLAAIGSFITEGVKWIIKFYLSTRFGQFASILATSTLLIGMFSLFTAATYAAWAALDYFAPPGFSFALSFIPPSAPVYYNLYMTALTSKRTFDWVTKIYMQTTGASILKRQYVSDL